MKNEDTKNEDTKNEKGFYIPEILTPVEAASILKCEPKTVYGLMDQRKITYIKVGKCRRIKREDLQEFINKLGIKEAKCEN
jgi:excisionase family DNA binding protein